MPKDKYGWMITNGNDYWMNDYWYEWLLMGMIIEWMIIDMNDH